MDRLTERKENGEIIVKSLDSGLKDETKIIWKALAKLAAYEDTGLMPYDVEELRGKVKQLEEQIEELEWDNEDLDWKLEEAMGKNMGDDL